MMWNNWFRLLTLFMVFKMYVACSEVNFTKQPSPGRVPNCQERGDCIVSDKGANISGSFKVRGQVDILFVVDNSGSMSYEHNRIDTSFPNFFDRISHLDYRIAMTTTDISDSNNPPREINKFGALQDGQLIRFDNGQSYLDTTSADAENLFRSAIKRAETLTCESFIGDPKTKSLSTADRSDGYLRNCPSSDERGIYATNLVISNNPDNFLRSTGHLAVIVISDEDVRSNKAVRDISKYSMVALDQPDTLLTVFDMNFPPTNIGQNDPQQLKSLSVHSIIVEPGDKGCLASQNSQTEGVKGAEGYEYAKASELTGGVIGSVCDADYTSQMGDIGNNIATTVAGFTIDCDADDLMVDYSPAIDGVRMVQDGKNVSFTGPLIMNSTVSFTYTCPLY